VKLASVKTLSGAIGMSDLLITKKLATYTRMEDGTQEDYLLLREHTKPLLKQVVDHALTLLLNLQESSPGNLIDRYQHSLQTATRAFRDGAEEEVSV
jgi:predicted HD phosphohydrolase